MLASGRQLCGDDTRHDRIDASHCGWVDYVQSPSPTDWLTITYAHDSAGRRIEKAYDGQTVCKYLYCPEPAERDGDHITAEYSGNNRRVWGHNPDLGRLLDAARAGG